MPVDVTVHVNLDDLRDIDGFARFSKTELRRAARGAIFDTIKHTKSFISRELRKHLPIAKKILDRNIWLTRPTDEELVGIVRLQDRGPLPLKLFDARSGKSGVMVRIDKQGPRTPVPPEYRRGLRTPFLVESLGGNVFARTGEARTPIRKLFGPAPSDVYEAEDIGPRAQADAEEYLEKRLVYRIERQFGGR